MKHYLITVKFCRDTVVASIDHTCCIQNAEHAQVMHLCVTAACSAINKNSQRSPCLFLTVQLFEEGTIVNASFTALHCSASGQKKLLV